MADNLEVHRTKAMENVCFEEKLDYINKENGIPVDATLTPTEINSSSIKELNLNSDQLNMTQPPPSLFSAPPIQLPISVRMNFLQPPPMLPNRMPMDPRFPIFNPAIPPVGLMQKLPSLPNQQIPFVPLNPMFQPPRPILNHWNQGVWVEKETHDNKVYYYHSASNETRWEKPENENIVSFADFVANKCVPEMVPPPNIQGEPFEWKEYFTSTGQSYYFNSRTKQSVWEKPTIMNDYSQFNTGIEVEENPNVETVEDSNKPKPVASSPIPGTSWCIVWTKDNRFFYFNTFRKESFWKRPVDLMCRNDVDELVENPPKDILDKLNEANCSTVSKDNKKRQKKTKLFNNKKKEKTSDPAEEAERKAAIVRENTPLEHRMKAFRAMLAEKEVSAFSTWEKELHKIVFDERYLLLNCKDRRQVFDAFVAERVELERSEKKNQIKKIKSDFVQMLTEHNFNSKSTYNDLVRKCGKDSRYKSVERSKEREILYNEHLAALKEKERLNTTTYRERRLLFMDLLKEQHVTSKSDWNKVKKDIENDARYNSIESGTRKQNYFNDYVENLRSESSIKAKREAESIKNREREVERMLSSSLRERNKKREHHKQEEAVEVFEALLVDCIRKTNIYWSDARKALKKDERRWKLVSQLSETLKERIFSDHIDKINQKNIKEFHKLIFENLTNLTLNAKWKELKKIIKDDPRFTKFSTHDSEREIAFENYMKSRAKEAKEDLRQLLRETKSLTYKTLSILKKDESYWKNIEDVLKKDNRYLVMSVSESTRKKIITSYLEDLQERGSPPPPTATDPMRRRV